MDSDGGPSKYYDFPVQSKAWCTLNDLMEYLARVRWQAYSLHLKDAMKACMRFGVKGSATAGYDARKIVYSGLRLLIMAEGKDSAETFLKTLIKDPQFKADANEHHSAI